MRVNSLPNLIIIWLFCIEWWYTRNDVIDSWSSYIIFCQVYIYVVCYPTILMWYTIQSVVNKTLRNTQGDRAVAASVQSEASQASSPPKSTQRPNDRRIPDQLLIPPPNLPSFPPRASHRCLGRQASSLRTCQGTRMMNEFITNRIIHRTAQPA